MATSPLSSAAWRQGSRLHSSLQQEEGEALRGEVGSGDLPRVTWSVTSTPSPPNRSAQQSSFLWFSERQASWMPGQASFLTGRAVLGASQMTPGPELPGSAADSMQGGHLPNGPFLSQKREPCLSACLFQARKLTERRVTCFQEALLLSTTSLAGSIFEWPLGTWVLRAVTLVLAVSGSAGTQR